VTVPEFGAFALNLVLLAVMLFGLFSLIMPIMPGLAIIWVAVLVYAFVTGLNWVSGILFAGITILLLAGSVVDHLFMGAGARMSGASWLSIGVALVAGLVGSILWPPFGGILLALAGIFLVEIIRVRKLRQAWDSTRNMAFGFGASMVVRFGIGVLMIGLWAVWVFLASK
jgi:uncharacterized protein YqgC (DUF456 family)